MYYTTKCTVSHTVSMNDWCSPHDHMQPQKISSFLFYLWSLNPANTLCRTNLSSLPGTTSAPSPTAISSCTLCSWAASTICFNMSCKKSIVLCTFCCSCRSFSTFCPTSLFDIRGATGAWAAAQYVLHSADKHIDYHLTRDLYFVPSCPDTRPTVAHFHILRYRFPLPIWAPTLKRQIC